MAKKKTVKKKNPVGRPNTYTLKMCEEICSRVADGESIKAVLRSDKKFPTFQTFCNWRVKNDELFDLYTRSIQQKSESVDDEIDQIMNQVKAKKIDFMAARLLIDTLKWKASKYYPKQYGDSKQVDVTSGGKEISIPLINWTEDDKD
jgi:hypothetical protein